MCCEERARKDAADEAGEVVPPLPEPISPERREELEAALDEQFAGGEDVDHDEGPEMYFPT